MSCADLCLALIAVVFPPIAVWVKSGLCSANSLINIALCCLGYFPGLLHAWYIIARNPEQDYDHETTDEQRDPEIGADRMTYYYVSHNAGSQRSYGATGPAQPGKPAGMPGPLQPGGHQQIGSVAPGPSSRPTGDEGAPPSYNDAVRGDHKVQSQD